MASEKVWTQAQREAAEKIVDERFDRGTDRDRFYGLDTLSVDLQCELSEALELLQVMYHEMGHLMITPEWQRKRREWLERNKESQCDG